MKPLLVALCTVDRNYVQVVDRALKAAGLTPTLIPFTDRPTHYIVRVPEEDVDRACAALHEYGVFVKEEEAHVE